MEMDAFGFPGGDGQRFPGVPQQGQGELNYWQGPEDHRAFDALAQREQHMRRRPAGHAAEAGFIPMLPPHQDPHFAYPVPPPRQDPHFAHPVPPMNLQHGDALDAPYQAPHHDYPEHRGGHHEPRQQHHQPLHQPLVNNEFHPIPPGTPSLVPPLPPRPRAEAFPESAEASPGRVQPPPSGAQAVGDAPPSAHASRKRKSTDGAEDPSAPAPKKACPGPEGSNSGQNKENVDVPEPSQRDVKDGVIGTTRWTPEDRTKLFKWVLGDDKNWNLVGHDPKRLWKKAEATVFAGTMHKADACQRHWQSSRTQYSHIRKLEKFTGGGGDGDDDDSPVAVYQRKIEKARAAKETVPITPKLVDQWYKNGWYQLFDSRYHNCPTVAPDEEQRSGAPVSDDELESGDESPAKEGGKTSTGDPRTQVTEPKAEKPAAKQRASMQNSLQTTTELLNASLANRKDAAKTREKMLEIKERRAQLEEARWEAQQAEREEQRRQEKEAAKMKHQMEVVKFMLGQEAISAEDKAFASSWLRSQLGPQGE